MVNEHLKMLGLKVKDSVTGYSGIVTNVAFDLYGCVTVICTPAHKQGEAKGQGEWFDIARMEVLSNKPVMRVPDFKEGYIAQGLKGGAEKPLP